MQTTINTKPAKFQPIDLSICIESREELGVFLALMTEISLKKYDDFKFNDIDVKSPDLHKMANDLCSNEQWEMLFNIFQNRA